MRAGKCPVSSCFSSARTVGFSSDEKNKATFVTLTDETLIQDTQTLEAFCQTVSFEPDSHPFLTVDTEFIRERTYWPQVCLIQIADAHRAVAIDPLAPGMDLAPLMDLLHHPEILKVFHSARQDIEIFHFLTGKIPTPLFDTQIAAMVCGFGDSVSYENLVQAILKQRLDKSSRLTDWAQRPLTSAQLRYALGDVIHLRGLYTWFREKLQKNKRESWIEQEIALLLNPETYQMPTHKAWTRLKGGSPQALKPLSFTVLKELATLREQAAQNHNLPRRKIVRDEVLFELASALPTTVEALKRLRGMAASLSPALPAETIVNCIAKIAKGSPEKWEATLLCANPPSPDKEALALFRLLLKICADEHGIAQRLIGTGEDLEFFVREKGEILATSPLLQGWRFDIFGKEALDLKAGNIALTIQQGRVRRMLVSTTVT